MTGILVDAVDKFYGDNHVVKGLTLDIPDGTFVSILGPSGCGKTTLLRMLAGFLTPDGGEIRAGNKVLSSVAGSLPPERRDMGMVFQQYAIWPHMNVFENVAFGLQMAKVPKSDIPERVLHALETVGLKGFEERGSAELSGGQQQRLALARALVTRPSVLLLDEPLSNLDARLREQMRIELRRVQRETGITFIYVTHDQIEAMSMSDSIAILNHGVVEQYGAPEELYESPASAFVVNFLGLTNWFYGDVVIKDPGSREVTVKLHSGQDIVGTAASELAVGQRVGVAVRPEDFRITDRPESENVMVGKISFSLFMGSFIEHRVKMAGADAEVVVQTGRTERLQAGSEVRFHAVPALTRVVPSEDVQKGAVDDV